jgi:putative hydrolase of the HAD superfamily
MGRKIEAIIFDCFGVLAKDTWEAFLDSLPEGTAVENARQARHAYDAGLISRAEYSRRIKAATGQLFVGVEDSDAKVAKNDKLLTYIRGLRERHYKISILSNAASNWIREEFLDINEQALFDDFVLSYEIGMVKPDPQLFALSAERLHVTPSAAVLVDDKERYCQAAQDFGMSAVLYRNIKQCHQELEKLLRD